MRIPPDNHLTALVRHFQAADASLKADGIYGPKTAAALDRYIADNAPSVDLLAVAWGIALSNVGKGGEGGNNRGPFIQMLRRVAGFPVDDIGPWCAVFVSAMLKLAGIPIRSRGAYRLCETMANHAEGYELKPAEMVPGRVYLACWKRGRWDTHQEAHIRFVRVNVPGFVEYIGGNERGDKVSHGQMGLHSFEKDLIMVVGWGAR